MSKCMASIGRLHVLRTGWAESSYRVGRRSKRGQVNGRTVLLDDPNNSYGVGRRIISV